VTGVVEAAPYVAGALGAGGIGVLASRRRELIRRWGTWMAGAPLVGGALMFGAPGAAVLAAALAVVATAEYARLTALPRPDAYVLGAVVLVVIAAGLHPALLPRACGVAALVVVAVPVLAGDAAGGTRRAAYGLLGLCWLGSLAALVVLHATAFALLFAVSVGDVGAWCAGRALGGPRLSPLSPAKTVAGLAGGAATGVAALAVLGVLNPACGVAVAAGGPLGDLFESMLKRGAGVKDAGHWLPGFGGLLDRIDSVLFTLAVAAVLS
jgi:phosphatidate cytidylyltransferase